MSKSVLVPLDTSIFASNALPIARVVARQAGGLVHLARVRRLEPAIAGDRAVSPPPLRRTHAAHESWERRLEDVGRYFIAELGPHHVRTALLEGSGLGSTLATYAQEQDVGLIVMGANGLRSDGYQRGTDAAADLARKAEVPVLLVHPEFDASHCVGDRRFTRVLIALSGTELDDELVAAVHLIECAEPLHCTIVHVLTPASDASPSGRRRSGTAYVRGQAAKLEGRGHVADNRVITSDDICEAIVNTAQRVDADLVIAGSVRRSGSQAGLGGITTRLFRELDLPLLVVAPRHRVKRQ